MARIVVKLAVGLASAAFALAVAEAIARAVVLSKSGATDFASYRDRCLGKSLAIFEADAAGELVDLVPGSKQGDRVSINAQGFRGKAVAMPKPDANYRVCLVGGSGAFGTTSTNDGTTIAAFLEKSLRAGARDPARVEVMNGGLPGATTARAITRYEQKLARFQPDVVLLYNLVNDLLTSRRAKLGVDPRFRPLARVDGPISNALSWSALWLTWQASRTHAEKRNEGADAARREATAQEREAKKRELRDATDREREFAWDGRRETNLYLEPAHVAEFREQLRRFDRVVRASGATPVFCTFAFRFTGAEDAAIYAADGPATAFYMPSWPMAWDAMKAMNDVVREVAAETGAAVCDVDRLLPRTRSFFPERDTDHFTDEGCRAVGEILATGLREKSLLRGAAEKR